MYCSVLQFVAVCCSLLQCVAVCCSVLQCGAVWCCVMLWECHQWGRPDSTQHTQKVRQYECVPSSCIAAYCSVLQCVAVSVLQCIAASISPVGKAWQYAINADSSPILVRSLFMYCSVLQRIAVCCSVLQCAAESVLQCISANVSPVGKAWQFAINADSSPILVHSLFMYCSVLQCVTVCCGKCVAVYCSECVTSGEGLAVRNKCRQFANIGALSLHVPSIFQHQLHKIDSLPSFRPLCDFDCNFFCIYILTHPFDISTPAP